MTYIVSSGALNSTPTNQCVLPSGAVFEYNHNLALNRYYHQRYLFFVAYSVFVC